jgi:hypothetical protein
MDEIGREVAHDPREAEGGGEVDLVGRREADQIVALAGAARELAAGMRDEHRAVAARAQADDRQEDLVLSPAPRASGVDVEGEHLRSKKQEASRKKSEGRTTIR